MSQTIKRQQLNTLFQKGQNLFKNGKLIESKKLFQKILASNNLEQHQNLHYECLLNLSTIYLQQNQVEQAKKILQKAMTINQYRYEAFYNLAVANSYAFKNQIQTISSIQYCLSLLYFQLGTITDSLKMLNKSISLNPSNPKPYLNRALIYEKNKKQKLAENQYEKLTFQNDLHEFSSTIKMQIYLQKCLFYRRINKLDKMQENLIIYNKLKKQSQQNINQVNPKVKLILQQQNIAPQQQSQYKQTIRNLINQVHDLIKQINHQIGQKKSQKNKNFINQFQHQNQGIKQNFPRISKIQNEIKLLQPGLLDQQSPFSKSLIQQQNKKQQHPSISINQDQDSAILNHKIEQLQRQIKDIGGNVPQIKDISKNSQEENFLQFQIQKTIQEINQKRQQQHLIKNSKNLQSSTQRSSLQEDVNPLIQYPQSDRRKSSFNDDAMTLRSKISQSYQINIEEMRTYHSFQLQIRSVSMFDQTCPKKEAYIRIKYLNNEFFTEKCKNQKLTWNHNFEEKSIDHSLEEEGDQTFYQLFIEIHAQKGGWLSWHKDVVLGTGIIKLTEKGATKCILQLNQQKVGMLYYKIKLKKSLFEQEFSKSTQ